MFILKPPYMELLQLLYVTYIMLVKVMLDLKHAG